MVAGCIVLFTISLLSFVMSIRSFAEKGFLFNNAYIHASERERETMNKRPYYRQSGTVFLLIGLLFLFNGFHLLFEITWMLYVVIAMVVGTLVYAVVSSVMIEKRNKNKKN